VVHVVRYLEEELILWIKQHARLRVIQRRMKCRSRTFHRDASGTTANCTTTQIPPPQYPVTPPNPTPVSVYRHRNVQKSMEMNQTLQSVSVVLKDVLLLVRIAINLLVFVVMYHHAVKKMVLQPTMLPVSVDQQNVLRLVRIVIHLLVCVVSYHRAVKKMVLQLIVLPVSVDQLNVLLIPAFIVLNLPVRVRLDQNVPKSTEMHQTLQAVSVVLKDVLLLVRTAFNLPIYVHHVHRQLVLLQLE
jgi:hypothetical protein